MIRSFLQKMGEREPGDFFERLDPRAKLIALTLVTVAASLEREALVGLYAIISALAIVSGLWKMLVFSTIGGIVMWLGFANLLMPLTGDTVEDPFMLFAGLVLRLSIYSVVGIWFAVKTNLYDFGCALEKWRLPSCVVLPFIIAIRFVPTLLAEFAAVKDAMSQRGLYTGPRSAFTNPAQTFRCFITPMLIRSLKMADELTVAAETRGIGRLGGRSYYREIRFTRNEFAFLGCVLLLVAVNSVLFRSYLMGWFI